MPNFYYYLFFILLCFACKKTNSQKHQTENLLIRYTFDEGFTGVQRHHILAVSKEIAQKHELADFAQILILPKPEINKILQTFDENAFKNIRTEHQLVADRGGVLIEVRYLNDNMRIIKANSGESFVLKDDLAKFNRCKEIIEQYLKQY
ncbi:MAG: hypothetical protein ACK40K_05105 [Raineya sp.]